MTLHRRFLAFALTIASTVSASAAPAAELKPAPAWEMNNLDGKITKLSDFRGKVVILNFWATWCPPCRKEIPGFIKLQNQYSASGLVVVGASVDSQGPEVVKTFVTQQGINYPIVMAHTKVVADYGGIKFIPTTFVIDRQGNIVQTYHGLHSAGTFESAIKPLLDAK